MYDLPDHPDIARAMRTGETSPLRGNVHNYICPLCFSELDAEAEVYTLSVDGVDTVIGCAECVEIRTAEGVYA